MRTARGQGTAEMASPPSVAATATTPVAIGLAAATVAACPPTAWPGSGVATAAMRIVETPDPVVAAGGRSARATALNSGNTVTWPRTPWLRTVFAPPVALMPLIAAIALTVVNSHAPDTHTGERTSTAMVMLRAWARPTAAVMPRGSADEPVHAPQVPTATDETTEAAAPPPDPQPPPPPAEPGSGSTTNPPTPGPLPPSPAPVVSPDARSVQGPAPAAPGPGSGSGGSWLDGVAGQVQAAVNAWLAGLVAGAVLPAAQLAGSLMDPAHLSTATQIHQLWASSQAVANTLYVLFVLAGGVILLGHESVQSRYALKEILPRLLLGWIASNLSWWFITALTQLAAALALAVAGNGVAPKDVLAALVSSADIGGPTFLVVLLGVITIITIVLVLTLIVIATLLLILTVLAPLALCLHALPQTEQIAWLWWRTFTAVLAIPTLHALLLGLIARIVLTPGGLGFSVLGLPTAQSGPGSLLNLLVVIALLYFMVKIPGWVLRTATGASPRGGGVIRSLVKTALITAGLSAIGAGPLGSSVAGAAGRGGARRAVGSLLGSAIRNQPRAYRHHTPPPPRPPTAVADPYRQVRARGDGQLMLPLGSLTRAPRPTGSTVAGTGATDGNGSSSGSTSSSRHAGGRQLALPLGQDWPENRPVLGRDGQYRLPLPGLGRSRRHGAATPRATPAVPSRTTTASASSETRPARARQLALPLGQDWPEHRPIAGPGGQYRLPLPGVTRRPRPAPAEPRPTSSVPSAPRPARARQLVLPLGQDWPENRPVLGRDGQYRLPIPLTHTAPPPAAPPEATSTAKPARRRRGRPLHLPLAWPTTAPEKRGRPT
jgi:hypothetical protein